MNNILKYALKKLKEGKSLNVEESMEVVEAMAADDTPSSEIADILTTLRAKGETVDELTGFALKMREMAVPVDLNDFYPVIDSCGTGGDCSNTFNISTASAILASSSGLNVAKHSNFGFTSRCGSSNVVEALGLKLSTNPEDVTKSIKKHNLAFLHAPFFHPSTKRVGAVRKDLGIRTIFNFLGPLTNPAKPSGQIIGVPDPDKAEKMCEVLKNLGCKRAMVVSGLDPVLDEISVCGDTLVYRLENCNTDKFVIKPDDFGFVRAKIQDIKGDTPDVNAKIIEGVLNGTIADSRLDAVLINTSALFYVGERVDDLREGIKLARKFISSGEAANKIKVIREEQ